MTDLVQLLVKGAALGGVYALVALGFVVVFKATGVINFAHGSLMLLGSYLAYTASISWGLPFPVAVLVAVAGAVVSALAMERVVLRRMLGRPVVAVLLVTIGLAIVVDQLVTAVWGFRPHPVGDPWGARSVRVGGVVLAQVDLATLAITGVMVAGLSVFFRTTRMGLALRAAASDLEAAVAQGISPALISRWAWGLAAGVAAVAGALLASGTGAASPELGEQALRAFPAVVLGGFASLGGAVIGGLVIGVVEVLTAGYAPGHAPWLGTNAHLVAPYVVMLVLLAVRPDGLLGSREARRL
ncbi:MAG: branched-chain amino acid ABC transporter permease [Acidimicrobiales bacterium]|nr:branched-chain amino acid ABC transporter permease [Actinomycetota bacterium]